MRQQDPRTVCAPARPPAIFLARMLLAVLLCPVGVAMTAPGAHAASSESGRDTSQNVYQNSDRQAVQHHTPDTSPDHPTSPGQRGEMLVVHISTTANKFVNGAELKAPQDRNALDCQALYERRLALYRQNLDTDAPFLDDPRTRTSMIVGAVWPPALLYLPYAAAERYLDDIERVERTAEINDLAYASSAQDCFLD